MLPSRLFRCVGIPPPLRSLMVIHPALPPSVAVQLRFRLKLLPRMLSTAPSSHSASSYPRPSSSSAESSLGARETTHPSSSPSSSSLPPARTPEHEDIDSAHEPRLQLTFTCTVSNCAERSTHQFTKRAYERGIVLVTCPKCKNRRVPLILRLMHGLITRYFLLIDTSLLTILAGSRKRKGRMEVDFGQWKT